MHRARTYAFMLANAVLGGRGGPQSERKHLGDLAIDHYEPRGKVLGTIACIHGMSPLGERDPRMVSMCRAMALVGFRVVAPHMKSVAQLQMRAGQVDEIVAALNAIANDTSLCPDQVLSVFSVSFSAGIVLVAAARPEVAQRVRALCLVGGYCDPETAIANAVNGDIRDPYSRFIVLANVAAQSDDKDLAQALFAAANDNFFAARAGHDPADAPRPTLQKLLAKLPTHAQSRIRGIVHEPAQAKDYWLAQRPTFESTILAMSPRPVLHKLSSSLTLIHGAQDAVISADQSRLLAQSATAAGVANRLLITPLLSHGDVSMLKNLRAIPAMAEAFAGFFEETCKDR